MKASRRNFIGNLFYSVTGVSLLSSTQPSWALSNSFERTLGTSDSIWDIPTPALLIDRPSDGE